MEIYSPNPNRKSSNYDSMVEQITPNMNIIIHNKTKTPLDKFNRSSNGNMVEARGVEPLSEKHSPKLSTSVSVD